MDARFMGNVVNDRVVRQVAAQSWADDQEIARLRTMSLGERACLIEAACRAAAGLLRDRTEAGALPIKTVPWPQSTWDFLTRQAAHVRNRSTT
jgi:hypothetical protein